MTSDPIRSHIIRLLDWQDAHVSFDAAIEGIPAEWYGVQPQGLPYSPWQLLEHLRLTQYDILEFCRNPDYKEPIWPDEYWPRIVAPEAPEAWDESIRQFRAGGE